MLQNQISGIHLILLFTFKHIGTHFLLTDPGCQNDQHNSLGSCRDSAILMVEFVDGSKLPNVHYQQFQELTSLKTSQITMNLYSQNVHAWNWHSLGWQTLENPLFASYPHGFPLQCLCRIKNIMTVQISTPSVDMVEWSKFRYKWKNLEDCQFYSFG